MAPYSTLHSFSGKSSNILATNRSSDPTCNDLNSCRTRSDIVWSCLVTTFLCTWSSLHPNIPSPFESQIKVAWRRFGMVLLALIAPELVVAWAMRQWFAAGVLAKKYQAYGWTRTHGYFALMGGFMLFDATKSPHILHPNDLEPYIQSGAIDITEKEIQDRSKGDTLSKSITLVQTLWFVLQCIVRATQGLSITHLEISTLAFVLTNFATYMLWWKKPLNVGCSQPVSRGKRLGDHQVPAETVPQNSRIDNFIETFYRPLARIAGFWEEESLSANAINVPTFYYAPEVDFDRLQTLSISFWLVALAFGAVHCSAWSFISPSHAETVLWRTASFIITFVPAAFLYGFLFFSIVVDNVFFKGELIAYTSTLVFTPFYVAARIVLLALSFITLQSLPPTAYQTVRWTDVIPHI